MDFEEIKAKAQLICKYNQNLLSEREKEELENWLSESEENREFFQRVNSGEFLNERREKVKMFDSGRGFNRFARTVHFKTGYRRIRWYWGAAACVLFIIGSSILFLTTKDTKSFTEDSILSARGFAHARLTLADGKTFEFSGTCRDSFNLNGTRLIASGERIEYLASGHNGDVEYNTLEVPRKGEFFLLLSDGTKVWLNSETSLRYPVAFTEKERVVFVEGEAFFEVKKDSLHPFIVKMKKGGEITVVGTEFNVRSYSDENNSEVTLVNGKVNLKTADTPVLSLVPGEQGCFEKSGIEKRAVNVNLYTSWKDGRFVFKEQSLEEIMKTISRWYDVSVTFANERVKKTTFSGNLPRYNDFGKILRMLEAIKIARFEIKENNICINEYK